MRFTKMEGLGNDYVYVNCFREKVYDPEILARLVSDRHRGIGGDGLILIGPSARADFNMDIYNADGSRAEMCGNGIRCLGKYVYDHGMTEKTEFTVETQAGIKRLRCILQDGRVVAVCVDMGRPDIGAAVEMAVLPDETVDFVRVSMGNPHAVVWLDGLDVACVTDGEKTMSIGALMEKHDAFPSGTNVEFVRVIDRDFIQIRVWERGSGETMACGTGACAAAAACMAKNYTNNVVTVQLGGGELHIEYDRNKKTINMTGPARKVFDGQVDIFSQEE